MGGNYKLGRRQAEQEGQVLGIVLRQVVKRVLGEMRSDDQQETGHVTGRQLEVLCLLAIGLTSSEVAKRLGISEHTVIRHVTNMGMSVGAGNRLELLALAIIGGLIDPNHWPPKPTGQLRLQIS